MNRTSAFVAKITDRLKASMTGRFLPDCEETTRRISESMDTRLSLRRRIGLRLHLLFCSYCLRYEQQLQKIRAVVRLSKGSTDEKSAKLSPEARRRIQRAIRSSSEDE